MSKKSLNEEEESSKRFFFVFLNYITNLTKNVHNQNWSETLKFLIYLIELIYFRNVEKELEWKRRKFWDKVNFAGRLEKHCFFIKSYFYRRKWRGKPSCCWFQFHWLCPQLQVIFNEIHSSFLPLNQNVYNWFSFDINILYIKLSQKRFKEKLLFLQLNRYETAP